MNATVVLERDHRALFDLFDEFERSSDAPAARRHVFERIKEENRIHWQVEEDVFYPALMRAGSTAWKKSVREGLEERQVLEGLLAELAQLEPEDEGFGAKMKAFREKLERHIRNEERKVFADARRRLSPDRLEELGEEIEACRSRLTALA